MITVTLPDSKTVVNSIKMCDMGFIPEYVENHSYDPSYFNEYNAPIRQLLVEHYRDSDVLYLKEHIEQYKKEYERMDS